MVMSSTVLAQGLSIYYIHTLLLICSHWHYVTLSKLSRLPRMSSDHTSLATSQSHII